MAVEVGASLPVLQETASVQPQIRIVDRAVRSAIDRSTTSRWSDHSLDLPLTCPFPILDGHSASHAPASK